MALEPDILFYTLESCHLRDVGKQVLELRGGLVSPFVRQKSLASPESGTCNTLIVFICSAFSLAFPLHLALWWIILFSAFLLRFVLEAREEKWVHSEGEWEPNGGGWGTIPPGCSEAKPSLTGYGMDCVFLANPGNCIAGSKMHLLSEHCWLLSTTYTTPVLNSIRVDRKVWVKWTGAWLIRFLC